VLLGLQQRDKSDPFFAARQIHLAVMVSDKSKAAAAGLKPESRARKIYNLVLTVGLRA
jgi:hypothetical protein